MPPDGGSLTPTTGGGDGTTSGGSGGLTDDGNPGEGSITQVTPEPASMVSALLGSGLLGLAAWRRKRRERNA